MARDRSKILRAAEAGFVLQDLELAEARTRQLQSVVTKTATGTGNIGHLFKLDQKYRLVFIRCHFSGIAGTAPFAISVDSGSGAAYDTRLFTITQAGTNKDVHLRIGGGDTGDPSAWTFTASDAVRIDWTNPASGSITWGLEVGLALAS